MSGDVLDPREAIAQQEQEKKEKALREEIAGNFEKFMRSMSGDFGKNLISEGVKSLGGMGLKDLEAIKSGNMVYVEGLPAPTRFLSEIYRISRLPVGLESFEWTDKLDDTPVFEGWKLTPKP